MKLKNFFFTKIKSTNITAIRLIKKGEPSGIISADIQTKGKGQRGNKWISKKHIHDSIKFYGDCNYSRYLQKITSNK